MQNILRSGNSDRTRLPSAVAGMFAAIAAGRRTVPGSFSTEPQKSRAPSGVGFDEKGRFDIQEVILMQPSLCLRHGTEMRAAQVEVAVSRSPPRYRPDGGRRRYDF